MTEFLEKVEQPELVVTRESATTIVASEVPTVEDGELANIIAGQVNGPASNSPESCEPVQPAQPSGSANSGSAKSPVDYRAPVENNQLNDKVHPADKLTPGLKRHRSITGACIALSMAILGLSLIDLTSLIERRGTLDSNLKFTLKSTKTGLPDSLSYYDEGPASEGLRKVRSSNWSDSLLGFADETGKPVLPLAYTQASDFHDGLAAVKFGEGKDKSLSDSATPDINWKYIDQSGNVVIPTSYTTAGDFQNGVAPVVINDFGALIDKKGNIIKKSTSHIAPTRLGDLYDIRASDGLIGLVDNTGKYVVPPQYDKIEKIVPELEQKWKPQREYSPNYFNVWKNGKCGLIDQSGVQLIPAKFELVATYNRGHAVVLDRGNYGIVDANGDYLIKPNYKLITMYDDVIAALDHQQNWHLFDSSGKLLPLHIDGAVGENSQPWLYDGMAAVIIGDKCGFINSRGEVAITPQYDLTKHFSSGYGLVQKGGMWRYIDKTGKLIKSMTFADAEPLKMGGATVTVAGPLFTFVNASQLDQQTNNASSTRQKFKFGEAPL